MTMSMSGPVDTVLIRTLPTADLALKLLDSLAESSDQLNANSTMRSAEGAFRYNDEADVDFLLGRLSDAWAWLESRATHRPSRLAVLVGDEQVLPVLQRDFQCRAHASGLVNTIGNPALFKVAMMSA